MKVAKIGILPQCGIVAWKVCLLMAPTITMGTIYAQVQTLDLKKRPWQGFLSHSPSSLICLRRKSPLLPPQIWYPGYHQEKPKKKLSTVLRIKRILGFMIWVLQCKQMTRFGVPIIPKSFQQIQVHGQFDGIKSKSHYFKSPISVQKIDFVDLQQSQKIESSQW